MFENGFGSKISYFPFPIEIVLPFVVRPIPLIPDSCDVAGADTWIDPLENPMLIAPSALKLIDASGSVVLEFCVVFPNAKNPAELAPPPVPPEIWMEPFENPIVFPPRPFSEIADGARTVELFCVVFPSAKKLRLPTTPVAPVGPVAPVAPVAPADPVAPVAPAVPAMPVAPVAPAEPAVPVAPVAPVGPATPVAPVAPSTPATPVAPVAPVAPVGPVAPDAPVIPSGPVAPVAPVAPNPVAPVAP